LVAASGILNPGIKISWTGEIIANETSEDTRYKRVTITVSLEIFLNVLRGTGDAAGSQESFCIRRLESGEALVENPRDRLDCWIEQNTRKEPRSDQNLRRCCSGKCPEQVIIFRTNR